MKIAVLVSGGVDSAVALALLKEQGHDVTAFYLKIWLEDELAFLGECPWEDDLHYVKKVCEQLNVELVIVPLQKEYHERVVSYTIQAVKEGRTPNPDVLCNSLVKFGAFFEVLGSEYDKVATGHYAHVYEELVFDGTTKTNKSVFYLALTPDPIKDQTYFLAQLNQAQLSRVVFPLGKFEKKEVRALAERFELANKDRKDSQGLCFLGKIKFRDFIKEHVGTQEGSLVEYETGKCMGTHEGFWFYTSGQRQGMGLSGGPWYVVGKDIAKNIVFISREYHAADKARDTFLIDHCNWFAGCLPQETSLLVKMRHGPKLYPCTLQATSQGLLVTLESRDQGIAAGQFAVFYKENVCLGSATITATF